MVLRSSVVLKKIHFFFSQRFFINLIFTEKAHQFFCVFILSSSSLCWVLMPTDIIIKLYNLFSSLFFKVKKHKCVCYRAAMFFGGEKAKGSSADGRRRSLMRMMMIFLFFQLVLLGRKNFLVFNSTTKKKRGANVLTCDEEQSFVLMKIHIIPLDETIAVGFSYLRSA